MQQVPYRDRPFCFFDIETTGLKAGYHEVTEIGFIHEKLGSMCLRIMPRHIDRADPEALEISGFNPEDWAGERDLDTAISTIAKFLEDTIPVGHNIGVFDIPFLRGDIEAKKLDSEFIPRVHIDTQVLATAHLVSQGLVGMSLNACCDHFGISNDGAHNAYVDAMRTKAVYENIMKCLKWIGLQPQQELF